MHSKRLWQDLGLLRFCIQARSVTEEFQRAFGRVSISVDVIHQPALFMEFWDLLKMMLQSSNAHMQSLAYETLRSPFELFSESQEKCAKVSMALGRCLPSDLNAAAVNTFVRSFERDCSFLVMSEEWDTVHRGLQLFSFLRHISPAVNLELVSIISDYPYWREVLPSDYIRTLLFPDLLIRDPLVQLLISADQSSFDVALLCLLIGLWEHGTFDADFVVILKASSLSATTTLFTELSEVDPTCIPIVQRAQSLLA
jgi:hypothetical protein